MAGPGGSAQGLEQEPIAGVKEAGDSHSSILQLVKLQVMPKRSWCLEEGGRLAWHGTLPVGSRLGESARGFGHDGSLVTRAHLIRPQRLGLVVFRLLLKNFRNE